MAKKANRQAQKRRELKRARRKSARHTGSGRQSRSERLIEGVEPLADEQKLSHRVLEIARPLLDVASPKAQHNCVSLGVLCWNAALVDPSRPETMLAPAVERLELPPDEEQFVWKGIRNMIERKQWLYPDDRRFVIDYQFTPGPDGGHLLVANAPMTKDLERAAMQGAGDAPTAAASGAAGKGAGDADGRQGSLFDGLAEGAAPEKGAPR
jgi:hypothetical protein